MSSYYDMCAHVAMEKQLLMTELSCRRYTNAKNIVTELLREYESLTGSTFNYPKANIDLELLRDEVEKSSGRRHKLCFFGLLLIS
ncbi:hypothetical protein CHS0354_023458 [Potamilus streckersoni]|uniref:Uncharacterized protein n=1 Tax=Potamilus streckersoni TaxID=2493646 RepID=A0AAE0S4E7_9BIVA|nr:hypothetical protein CHS0354_023458 [Potamilus streckersoni]